ncbi:MAG: hypothetical protein ACRD35_02045 [Candidatus Acidiferrales bacterium]
MNFNQNLKAFLRALPLSKMTGHQKFLSVAAVACGGKEGVEIATKDIDQGWRKSLLRVKYNPSFHDRAQREGWVDPISGKKGIFVVTRVGLDHLTALPALDSELSAGELKQSGRFIIVNRKATHTFDKFLRKVLAEAKIEVLIADSWVDGTIFDDVLDVTPKTIPVKLIYAQATDNFQQRAKRFSTEYPRFIARRYKHLHDRFMVVGDTGYVLGPSIKDAASNSPALVVELGTKEKHLLRAFFEELWKKTKAMT